MAEISDYLNDLGEQKFQEESKILVVESPGLDLISEKYEEWLKDRVKGVGTFRKFYLMFRDLKYHYTAKNVRDFSFMLRDYQDREDFYLSGLFLSALINAGRGKNFEVITRHLSKKLYFIGLESDKNILVIGDTGWQTGTRKYPGKLVIKGNTKGLTGAEMICEGKIIVHGDVEENTGIGLRGGEIIVNGNVKGAGTGKSMRSGKITVNGTVDYSIGEEMTGGEIHVNGELAGIAKKCKGTIYQRNKLLWPKQ